MQRSENANSYLQITAVEITATDSYITIKNATQRLETDMETVLVYTCYDADGNPLQDVYIAVGRMAPREEKTFVFTIPPQTRRMALSDMNLEWWTSGWN